MLFFRITSFCAIPTTNACNRPQYVSKAEKNEFLAAEYSRLSPLPVVATFRETLPATGSDKKRPFLRAEEKHAYHARVSVWFQSKERGMRVKDREKNGR